MKIEYKGLKKALDHLPRKQRKFIGDAIRRSVIERVALARSMAPLGSGPSDPSLGSSKEGIHAKFEK